MDESNWAIFAGNRAQYWPYLAFFHTYINQHGIPAALEKFVFSTEANAPGVEMLARFNGGLIHPLIHVGYGAEFALNGIVAEGGSLPHSSPEPLTHSSHCAGLAMAIISDDDFKVLRPHHDDRSSQVGAVERLAGLDLLTSSNSNDQGLNLFSICELIAQDADIIAEVSSPRGRETLPSALEHAVPLAIQRGYFDLWKLTSADLRDSTAQEPGWMAKWEELVWFCSALSMGATVKPGQKMTHDFFLVHLNNAALFMPVLLPLLSERSRSDLLQLFFRICMTVWLGVGRPSFHIGATLMASTDNPRNPHTESAKAGEYGKEAILQEPPAWYGLAAAASVHGDVHHVKAIRALMFYDQHFAHRPAGFACVQTDLVKAQMEKRDALKGKAITSVFEGLNKLDGTAFVRTAGQLMQSQGWKTPVKSSSLELDWYVRSSKSSCGGGADRLFAMLTRSFDGFYPQKPSSQL